MITFRLSYYRARYYDPSSGRFVNEDPVRFAGGKDFYEFVGNSPIELIDPSGDCPIDLNKLVSWLDAHANPHSMGSCTKNVRQGLEAAGANTKGSPVSAKDWGPFLTNNLGFSEVPQGPGYSPKVGDISVFQPANGSNPNGHIEVWDGTSWVSDYNQGPPLPDGTHFYPNLKKYGPQPFNLYRCN
ncbi:MAG TPA: RHS repeat-associated core domain-containing protein [Candidatus Acidoferrum sp.]|nr:RHS repeat-associated core domain-containing protein [Candidatus Acidoferrum sp.]